LWDSSTGKPIGQPLTGHTGSVNAVAFSPDGKTIASASADGTVRRWDPSTGKTIGQPLTGAGPIYDLAFSTDGKMIASGGADGTVRRWDPSTGKTIGQPLTGAGPIYGVTFGPGGTLASVGDDGAVRRWEGSTGKTIGQPLTGHTGPLYDLAFSPDGKTIASGGADGTVRLWPSDIKAWVQYACTLADRNLTQQEWNQYLPGKIYVRTCSQLPVGYGAHDNSRSQPPH
jgi:WD40 repeat protein